MSLQVLIERDILARFIYAFLCSCNCLLGLLRPDSLAGNLAHTEAGLLMIIASGLLAVLLMLDTWINDVQPPDKQLAWTSRHRHLLHVAASLVFLAAMYSAARESGGTLSRLVGVYMYGGFAVIGLVIAWRDVRRRPGHLLAGV